MRLVSYNIMNGGEGRADPLAEVILAQRPDVVGLIESDDEDVLDRIARRLNMDFIHAAGHTHAVALLSRWPILYTVNHSLLPASPEGELLEAAVLSPDGQTLAVGVVNLRPGQSPDGDAHGRAALISLAEFFASRRQGSGPQLLMGDLGGESPADALSDCGYFDLLALHHPSAATYPTQRPRQRHDGIFGHGIAPAQIRSAWVEQDRLAKYASDHFPIGAELVV